MADSYFRFMLDAFKAIVHSLFLRGIFYIFASLFSIFVLVFLPLDGLILIILYVIIVFFGITYGIFCITQDEEFWT